MPRRAAQRTYRDETEDVTRPDVAGESHLPPVDDILLADLHQAISGSGSVVAGAGVSLTTNR